jgi:aminomethyltransferase
VLDDRSLATGLVAVQGPRAVDIVQPLTELDLGSIRYYGIAEGTVAGIAAQVARTGYTGEDGFELFVDVDRAGELWDRLLEAGRPHGQVPVGLGARDTLRLEAGMPLYGNELDRTTNPFEAGLGRVVKLSKPGDFVGRTALERVVRDGVGRQLVGLEMRDRGIARHGYPVLAGTAGPDDEAPAPPAGGPIGSVTSGTMSPTLGTAIAMAYVPPAQAGPATMLAVEIRGAPVAAEVVPLPFYKRPA